MKTYKLKMPIGELFRFLNIDNNLYETFQPVDRNIKIKSPSSEYVKINHFVKKQGRVYEYNIQGNINIKCDEKHLIKQNNGKFKFIKDSNHVLIDGKSKTIESKKYLGYRDVYDVSLDNPHEYLTASGIVCHNTTLAKLLVKNIDCDYLYINASDEGNIDTLRNKIKTFASTLGFKDLKIVILDEADFCTPTFLAALRNLMETFSKNTRFILTCNYVEKIIEPIQSRCQIFNVIPPSRKEVAMHVAKILQLENIKFDINDLAIIVNSAYPDIRRVINTCQMQTVDKELVIDKQSLIEANYMTKVLECLKQPDRKKRVTEIRKLLIESQVSDFTDLYRFLYDNVSEFAKGNEASAIIILAEYQHTDALVVDKEIVMCACLIKLILEL